MCFIVEEEEKKYRIVSFDLNFNYQYFSFKIEEDR